ncbi:ATPase get3b [Citrus sinensis]|nr:ATPase get3b [Citrus sinensis]
MTTAACCFRSTSLPSSFSIHKKLAVKRNSNAVSFMGLLSFSPKTSSFSTGLISISLKQRRSKNSFQVRAVVAPSEAVSGFDEMVAGTQRKYYMLGGKGGVGKTSCAASLAVKFANNGHPTLVVSTDPAHSLSDSFAQDLTGGQLVPVEGPDFPLFALEINPEKAREEFRNVTQKDGGTGVKDFMDGMGLGMLVEQLGELKLGELLDTPPPGLDEAIAISKVCIIFLLILLLVLCIVYPKMSTDHVTFFQVIQFLESQEYSMFTRIVFDTAPTGHTLRLLSLPDFLDASIGKILKLREKIASATSAIKSVFGQEQNRQGASDKLERLRERMVKVRELFRDTDSTEFVIVTIPTVMAVSESSRLSESLKKENVPVKRLIVNQIIPPSASDCKFCAMKRKDQMRALEMIKSDSELSSLMLIEAPLVDVEIRGVPALRFMGDIIWK